MSLTFAREDFCLSQDTVCNDKESYRAVNKLVKSVYSETKINTTHLKQQNKNFFVGDKTETCERREKKSLTLMSHLGCMRKQRNVCSICV